MSSIAYPLGVPASTIDDPALKPYVAPTGMPGGTPGPIQSLATPAAPAANTPVVPPAPPSVVPVGHQLAPNPQLPAHPSSVTDPGTFDAQYEAEQAQLAAEISHRYNDVLKQLGYLDPSSGSFVMGRVETEANRQRSEINRNVGLAAEEQTKQRQLEGTLFSGRRGTEQARAQHPFIQSLADLDIQVPQQLSDLYEQGADLGGEYTRRLNLLLADAARRRAAGLITTATGTAPPGTTTPPPPTLPPPHVTTPGLAPVAPPDTIYNTATQLGSPQAV